MPITWRNVDGPNNFAANQLRNQATNQINNGLGQLNEFAQQRQQSFNEDAVRQEEDAAARFQQQLYGMDDNQVQQLQTQAQNEPDLIQQQFGSAATNVMETLQQEPERRVQKANDDFQMNQVRKQRIAQPITSRGTNYLSQFNMDHTNTEAREGVLNTINELEEMGATDQAVQLRSAYKQTLGQQEQADFQNRQSGFRKQYNTFIQDAQTGNMKYGDIMERYDQLVKEYGSDVVHEMVPPNEFSRVGRELLNQAGQLEQPQMQQIAGVEARIDETIGEVETRLQQDQEEIERINGQGGVEFFSPTGEMREGRTRGNVTQEWAAALPEGINQEQRNKLRKDALRIGEEVYSSSLKELFQGRDTPPGILYEAAMNYMAPMTEDGWFTNPDSDNEDAIRSAFEAAAADLQGAKSSADRVLARQNENRKILKTLRDEKGSVIGSLTQRLSGNPDMALDDQTVNDVIAGTSQLSQFQQQAQQTAQQPQGTPENEFQAAMRAAENGDLMTIAQRRLLTENGAIDQAKGNLIGSNTVEEQQPATQNSGAMPEEDNPFWDNENRSPMGNISNVARELFNLGPANVLRTGREAIGNVANSAASLNGDINAGNRYLFQTSGAEKQQLETEFEQWKAETGRSDVNIVQWIQMMNKL